METKTNDPKANPNELFDTNGLSKYLNLRPSRIRYEVFMGNIPHLKIGRSIRFSRVQIDEWLQSKQKGGGL